MSRQLAVLKDEKGASDPRQIPLAPKPVRGLGAVLGRFMSLIERLPRQLAFGLGVLLVGVTGWADLLAGAGVSLLPFYLLPVALVTWLLGRMAGIGISFVAAIGWSLAYLFNMPSIGWGSIALYWNIASNLAIFLLVSLILSGLRGALNQEKELARTDPITGAPNSRAFFEHVERELARSLRYGHAFTLAYLDVDNFKKINDEYGHTVGDQLLRVVADTVQANIRATDFAARIAGDEFTLLLPETGQKESELVMARVRKALAATMRDYDWPVTFSLGVVTFIVPPPTVDMLIQVADDIMYTVKRNGKNASRHEVYGERKGAA